LERDKNGVELAEPSGEIRLANDELNVPELRIKGHIASGLGANFVASGKVAQVMTHPELDVNVRVEPIDLARLSSEIPSVDRASGSVDAQIHIIGPLDGLRTTGAAHLRKGELVLKGSPLALEEANADIEIGGGDVRLKKASARIGAGTVEATGRMPLKGL